MLDSFVYPCPRTVCVGHDTTNGGTLTGCYYDLLQTGNTGMLCGDCKYLGEYDPTRSKTVKVNGKCYPRCEGSAGTVKYWAQFFVQYFALALLLRLNGGLLDVHVDGATINHLTFFFQTCQLTGKFGKADLFGILSLRDYINTKGFSDPNQVEASHCKSAFDMYGQFYVMVLAVPLFMSLFSMVLLWFENRKNARQTMMEMLKFERRAGFVDDDLVPPPSTTASCKSFLANIPVLEHKIAESSKAYRLDYLQNSTAYMAADDDRQEFGAPGMWWLVTCVTMQQGLRSVALKRTVVEICMFCCEYSNNVLVLVCPLLAC